MYFSNTWSFVVCHLVIAQKNKATSYHLGQLKAKLAKLKRELIGPSSGSGGGGGGIGFDVARYSLILTDTIFISKSSNCQYGCSICGVCRLSLSRKGMHCDFRYHHTYLSKINSLLWCQSWLARTLRCRKSTSRLSPPFLVLSRFMAHRFKFWIFVCFLSNHHIHPSYFSSSWYHRGCRRRQRSRQTRWEHTQKTLLIF